MEPTMEALGGLTLIVLPGPNLDASNAKTFRKEVAPLLEGRTQVLFDLSKVDFMDSSGLGAVLSCLRTVSGASGQLCLCSMTKPVRSLFELVRMHRVFDIYNTRDEAARAMKA